MSKEPQQHTHFMQLWHLLLSGSCHDLFYVWHSNNPAMLGHKTWLLCRAVARFRLLNAFFASTSRTPSVSSSSKISCIAWMAASHPASWPAPSWRDPTADWTSVLVTLRTALSTIRRTISHNPIGRTPGFLFSGISRQAVNDGRPEVSMKVVQEIVLWYWQVRRATFLRCSRNETALI